MNALDLLIMVVLLIGMLLGFVRGLMREVIGLFSLYITTLIAAFAYRAVGKFFKLISPRLTQEASESLAFLALMLLIYNFFFWSIYLPYKERRERRAWRIKRAEALKPILGMLDKAGGLGLSFALTCLWIGLGLLITDFVVRVDTWYLPNLEGIRVVLLDAIDGSGLVPVFRQALSIALLTMQPWFIPFGGLPPILQQFQA